MAGLLADIFSAGDTAKRKLRGLLGDPVGTMTQFVNNENDRAGRLKELTYEASSETGMGPKSQKLAGLLADAYNPIGMTSVKGPQAQALETARKNAVKMLGLADDNTPMDRARALGFDTEAFHATGNDFRAFNVDNYRGAASVAATPVGAVRGASAGAADMTGSGASSVMPLLMRSDGVQGLRLPQDQVNFLRKLPDVATESQVDDLMKGAPRGAYWGNFFDEVQNADGSFSYAQKSEPRVSFLDVQKTSKSADGSRVPNWGDEKWSSDNQKKIGGKGWLQQDEAGVSASIVDPSILRSRFAAFDPARVNENDLLGRADPALLGLLGLGVGGGAYLMNDK